MTCSLVPAASMALTKAPKWVLTLSLALKKLCGCHGLTCFKPRCLGFRFPSHHPPTLLPILTAPATPQEPVGKHAQVTTSNTRLVLDNPTAEGVVKVGEGWSDACQPLEARW